MAIQHDIAYSAAHGIAPAHWLILRRFAEESHLAIVLRGGKEKAIPWIEQGFPAKPLTMKAKVERSTGLLRCGVVGDRIDPVKAKEHRLAAFHAGYWVLDADPSSPSRFLARASEGAPSAVHVFETAQHPWLKSGGAGLVVDPRIKKPLTSDYDLAALVDSHAFNYSLTYGSAANAADRTNPWTEGVKATLNGKFGSARILHGSQAQYSGSPINDTGDTLVTFHPTGHVDAWSEMSDEHATRLLIALILAYHPDKAHVFHQ